MPRGQYERRPALNGAPVAEVTTTVAEAVSTANADQPVSRRAEETRRERRRRNDGDLDGMAHLKLQIPKEIEEQGKREGKVFRWFLETNVPDAYRNDWDKVEGEHAPEGVLANPVEGDQARLVLCSKFKDWAEDDKRIDERMLGEREEAMMSGQVFGATATWDEDPGKGDRRSSGGVVVPRGQQNKISRQRGL